jgi:hypothetical protein
VVEYLQPFSHQTTGYLAVLPEARAGLGAAAQGFEYAKELGFKPAMVNSQSGLYFGSSDLKEATDYCDHKISKTLLEGFYDGIGKYNTYYGGENDQSGVKYLHPYIQTSINLLCSARIVEYPLTGNLITSSRGILMGDPGAKAVLTLYNICAEEEAFLRWYTYTTLQEELTIVVLSTRSAKTFWRQFRCAGDDYLAFGPLYYIRCISTIHERNGLCVNKEQTFVSKRGGFYCEEALLRTHHNRLSMKGILDKRGKPLNFVSCTYKEKVHVDSIMMRLMSTTRKECGTGPNDSQEVNPAIGKGGHMLKKLRWMPTGWKNVLIQFVSRWRARMDHHIPPVESTFQYLPVSVGGLNFPTEDPLNMDWDWIWKGLHPLHRSAISLCLKGKSTVWINRTLSRFGSNQRNRGIDLSNQIIEDEIIALLQKFDQDDVGEEDSNTLCTAAYAQEIVRIGMQIPKEKWIVMRHWDRSKLMTSAGFIPLKTALRSIERPYIFRRILSGENVTTRRRFNLTPWAIRYKTLITDLTRLNVVELSQGFNTLDEVIDDQILQKWFKTNSEVYVRKDSMPTEVASLRIQINGRFGSFNLLKEPDYPSDERATLEFERSLDELTSSLLYPSTVNDGGLRRLENP